MCHIFLCARKDTRERKGEARRANVIIMPSKQRKKKRMKTSLAAFDDDESDEHEKNDARDDATDADDALCPGPKKLIGDKRVRTRYMPSFVPKDAKKTTTIARRDACKTTAVFDAAEGADRGAGDDGAKNNGLWKQHQRRKLGNVSPQEEEEEEEDKEEKKEEKKDERAEREKETTRRLSTNVIVKNLPSRDDFESLFPKERGHQQLFEKKVLESFAVFGPIASLSIRKSGYNNGASALAFVAFVAKSSAGNAIEKMNSGQFMFYGVQLEASLCEAVVVMEKVWPPMPAERKVNDGDDFEDDDDDESRRMLYLDENIHTRGEVKVHLTARVPVLNDPSGTNYANEREEGIVKVRFPKDYAQMKRIDVTATFVAEDGKALEHRIKAKKKEDPNFAFLFDTIEKNEETVYYLWRVFSLANGDSLTTFRTDPFRMFAPNGKVWVPPVGGIAIAPKEPCDNGHIGGNDTTMQWPTSNGAGIGAPLVDYALDRGETHNKLSETDKKRFEELVSLLTLERERVGEVTTFAIDHATCAEEVIAKLKEEMVAQKASQKLEAQVSVLYAFSDVLHNASAPVKHASSYRMVIKRALPDVFKMLGESLKLCGVIAKPPFMTRVLRVCKAWREWYAFDVSFCDELEDTFLGNK